MRNTDLGKRSAVLSGVVVGMLMEGILVLGEVGHGPVEGGHVQLVDGLGVGGGEDADGAAVEGVVEGQDGQGRRPRGLVPETAPQLQLRRRNSASLFTLPSQFTPLSKEPGCCLTYHVFDESRFISVFVGASTTHLRCNFIHPVRGNLHWNHRFILL